jgi:hypothetical protein
MSSADRVLVRDARRALPPGWVARSELALFLSAYLLCDAGRWLFAGDVAVEGSVQRALEGPAISYLLSTVYLAAQLVVLPGALIWLHRRSRPVYIFDVAAGLCAVAVGFVVCKVAPARAR